MARSQFLAVALLVTSSCATGLASRTDEEPVDGAAGSAGSPIGSAGAAGTVGGASASAGTTSGGGAGTTSGGGAGATSAGSAGTTSGGSAGTTSGGSAGTTSGGSAGATSGGSGGATSGGCGDGVVGAGEQCDDTNSASGDGCSSSCQWETNCQSDNPHPTIACGGSHKGSFAGTFGDVEGLCGKSFKYQDQIFVFTPTAAGPVTVTYTANGDLPDMAMFLMRGSCHAKLCVADSTTGPDRHTLTFNAEVGLTYYIDLEAPSQQPGYTLNVACP